MKWTPHIQMSEYSRQRWWNEKLTQLLLDQKAQPPTNCCRLIPQKEHAIPQEELGLHLQKRTLWVLINSNKNSLQGQPPAEAALNIIMEETYLHYLQEHKQIAWSELDGVVWAIQENGREESEQNQLIDKIDELIKFSGFLQLMCTVKVCSNTLDKIPQFSIWGLSVNNL